VATENLAERVYRSQFTPAWVRWAYRRARWRLVWLAVWWRNRRELAGMAPPESFSEKQRYKMLADRRPLLTTFADKVAVRGYVEAKLGPEFLTDLYMVTDSPAELEPSKLPREFVVKASHGSRGVVIVASAALPDADLPRPPAGWCSAMIRPERVDWELMRSLCREWLTLRYGGLREWAYRHVPPRLLCEEVLLDQGHLAFDYRFFVFHGHIRLIQVDHWRFLQQTQSFYTPEWERLGVVTDKAPADDIPKPEALPDMLSAAELLGAETDFVRVDLYAIGRRVVVGELTNYPWAGAQKFKPAEFDRQLGAWWTPPSRYTQRHVAAGHAVVHG
jgi:hypothetical protein